MDPRVFAGRRSGPAELASVIPDGALEECADPGPSAPVIDGETDSLRGDKAKVRSLEPATAVFVLDHGELA